MTGTPQDFALDIDRFVALAKGCMEEFVIEFIQDLNEAIVRATPVDTGFLRASWWASLGSAPAFTGSATADPSGAGAIARLNLVAAQIQPGVTYYAVNGAAYAMRVEFGFIGRDSLGRMYNQQPRAFVRGTLARADAIAAATAQRIAAQGTTP